MLGQIDMPAETILQQQHFQSLGSGCSRGRDATTDEGGAVRVVRHIAGWLAADKRSWPLMLAEE